MGVLKELDLNTITCAELTEFVQKAQKVLTGSYSARRVRIFKEMFRKRSNELLNLVGERVNGLELEQFIMNELKRFEPSILDESIAEARRETLEQSDARVISRKLRDAKRSNRRDE